MVGCRFPPFCRACLSLFRRESEKIDCSRRWWGWSPKRDGSKQAKEKRTEERQTHVSAKYLDETRGRSLNERKREKKERVGEKESVRVREMKA